jgi:hypothetical protein
MRGTTLLCPLVAVLLIFIWSTVTHLQASPDGASIGIKFAVDEPLIGGGSDETSEVEGPAGVLRTATWNNFELNIGGPEDLSADVNGEVVETNATVEWISANTWSSDGRTGEDLNDADPGPDRNLMLGYLDTDADNPAIVIVEDLDETFTADGYDVYVYILGGVTGRGGDYTIGDVTFAHDVLDFFDGTYVDGVEGNYLVFENLTSSGFELEALPTRGATRRAPINAIEIVARTTGGGLPGDFNQNGVLDAGDIDDLTGQSATGSNPPGYDLDSDALVNDADIRVWVKDLFNSWIGDANLDGEFNTSDLVGVLASGTYEADVDSVWTTGDFNGDGRTNTSDLVAALSDGGYEAGPRAAVAAVPEPSGAMLSWLAVVTILAWRQRRPT